VDQRRLVRSLAWQLSQRSPDLYDVAGAQVDSRVVRPEVRDG
jgi:hypothetical protein